LGGNVSDAVAVVATGGERRRYVGLGTQRLGLHLRSQVAGRQGRRRGLTPEEHAAGRKKIVADESLAVALAEYIGGFKAVLVLTG